MALALLLLACEAVVPYDPVPALEAYTEALLAQQGSKVVVDACEKVPESRAARCTLIGKEADADRLVRAIRGRPISGQIPGAACQGRGYLEGFTVDASRVPAGDGVSPLYVYQHLGRVCLDLELDRR